MLISLFLSPWSEEAPPEMEPPRRGGPAVEVMGVLVLVVLLCGAAEGWTGEIHGRVVCDVCGDSSIGPEDHVLEGDLAGL